MKIPNADVASRLEVVSLARIVSEDSQRIRCRMGLLVKSSKDS